jgi:two-component system LytT family response regulator
MLRSIIIDDEIAARRSLEKIIELYLSDSLKVEGSADNLKSGIQLINKFKPDVVFLDIEMPIQNGLELFDYVEVNFDVVVISAYKDYAIEALRNGATDYLLKPVNIKELKTCIERISENNKTQQTNTTPYTKSEAGKLLLPSTKGFIIFSFKEILAIEADRNYSVIHKTNGDSVQIQRNLRAIEEAIPDSIFFKAHRSSIINTQYVTEINREKCTVLLNNCVTQPISHNNIKILLEKLKEILNVDLD